MDNKAREEFIQNAVSIMTRFPEDNILIILHGPNGLKNIQSLPDVVWTFGVLHTMEKILDEKFRASLAAGAEMSAEFEKSVNDAIATDFKGVKQ